MSYITLEYLKQTLEIFFEANQRETKTVKTSKGGPDSQINQAIYDLENYLYELKKKNELNLALNADISSKHIRDSFNQSAPKSYSRADFEYNFLLFLAHEYKPEDKLRHYIRRFIDTFKENLTWMDLVITETRATRAFTNIRFAVNSLREQGLLHIKGVDNDGLHPTLLGLLVLLHVKQSTHPSSTAYPFIPKNNGETLEINFSIYHAIQQLSKPDEAIKFCLELIDKYGYEMELLQPLINKISLEKKRKDYYVHIAALVHEVEAGLVDKKSTTRTSALKPLVDALKSK